MTEGKTNDINKKIEQIFHNYYKKIGVLDNEGLEFTKEHYINMFLRERFVERILFTVFNEFEIKNPESKSILVVGFSHELVSFFIKLGYDPANITLADICPQVLDRAKVILSNRINVTKIDPDMFGFDENAFDIVICFNYLSNIPSDEKIEKIAGEFYRVLRQGGLALLSFTNEAASREDIQMSGVMRIFRLEEILTFFKNFKIINLLNFIPYNFILFSVNGEPAYPKKIGFVEDLLIEQEHRYTNSLLLLSK